MVMDPQQQRARYLTGTDGAPPVPPPGGYRGARRVQPPHPGEPGSVPKDTQSADGGKTSANGLGWVALSVAIPFAVILAAILLTGATELLYGVTLLAIQLVIVAVIVAALVSRRGRALGAIALAITLFVNVATVGGVSAIQTSASGSYDNTKTAEQKKEEAYPGVKDLDPELVLSQQSLEEVRAESEELFADIRTRLTEKFGYSWAPLADENLRPERNGYGGESMLVRFTAAGWATNEPIQGYQRKIEVMAAINDVLAEHGLFDLVAFNDSSSSGLDPTLTAKLYGSDDPRKQHTWEYFTENYPDPLRFYAVIHDLSNDSTGDFTTEREAESARTGEPVEGLQLRVIASTVLSEADRAEFEAQLQEYPNY